jgi:hypothetical protein
MNDVPVIISIKEGSKTYYTGVPCKRNHISTRRTDNHSCMECNRDAIRNQYHMNKDYRASYGKQYYNDNNECIRAYSKQWRLDNLDHHKAYSKQWRTDNMDRVSIYTNIRSKRIRHATLPGYDNVISLIYKHCPVGYQVDHIDPIRGKDRSGLNVPWNLQYLPATENRQKSNRVDYVCESAIPIDWKQYV